MTPQQRGYYFAGIVEPILELYTKRPELLYSDVYRAMVGQDGKQLIHGLLKVLFNSGRTTQYKKDDETNTKEFIDRVKEFYRDNYKLDLASINEPPIQ